MSDKVQFVFITHNIHHASPVGDRFTILNRGRCHGTFAKADISRDDVLALMAGGEDVAALDHAVNRELSAPGPDPHTD